MGKRKFCRGIMIGAVVGGLVAMRHPEVRSYMKQKLSQTTYLVKHPSKAVRNTRIAVQQFHEQMMSGTENAINALEQVEKTFHDLRKKSHPIE